ncbi:methylated-DNA--[protein]-cysteine S-methyltransferase [Rhodococcus sp. KBS0724]|jgi:methylated-DNA-[protein]-cysteine S-methyltransferase|uniref:methylated-DNA--[protein]-cysteine S-methyltransferase n=1 Tax=Rhodococcus sp. KBS0724 TaxID=1179674 RepID=UPI00110EF102|nr:methylated-DNA--[protein]-cysteine S-methyltransferase [Rhodococcus sp. KBS0724]TSD49488.1 methylated-DNA--[protein]-cysteine S-methyltransferase [Rhodococcus sp. KBS0724]
MSTDADVFGALPASDPDALARLHSRLADAAAAAQLIDVAYRIVDSPIGKLLIAATEAGLVRVAFAVEGHDVVLGRLAETVSPRVLHHPRRLDTVARELDEYFAGTRKEFDLNLDFQLAKGFRREVLRHLPEIEYGHTASYSAVATASGSPRAVRAVGTACAKNPLPLVVPCHRVVRSDGSLGQYAGGPELKAVLLDLESRQ